MKKFYDSHCHVMNLSHPNLTAIINRILREISLLDRIKIGLASLLFVLIGRSISKLTNIDNNIANLLAIMETELGDFLLQMEEDLRNNLNWNTGPILSDGDEKKQYDKVVLLPLIMDFGYKGDKKAETFYKVRWKPIASQVLDLCLGIKNYYKHRDSNPISGANPTTPLFEIYPFMGINTINYNLESKSDGTVGLKDLLVNKFQGFENDSPDTRRTNLAARDWRQFNGDIDTITSYSYIGIKLYPPLGFDPWPINRTEEMEKVHWLYSFCQKNKIPITAHCSNVGFLVDDKYKEFSDPKKWGNVLDEYGDLRLNLAHFGADNPEWSKKIIQLILRYDNVYTDISYQGVNREYYNYIKDRLNNYGTDDRNKLYERIIYGSDFMINLLVVESYSQYMRYFAETPMFSLSEKDMFCSKNPERFLFIS